MIVVVDLGDAERVMFAAVFAFDADELFIVAPTIIEGYPQYFGGVIFGEELPFASVRVTGIFALHIFDI